MNFKKRKHVSVTNFMQDLHRIQKKFDMLQSAGGSQNNENHDQEDNISSDSGSEFLDNAE